MNRKIPSIASPEVWYEPIFNLLYCLQRPSPPAKNYKKSLLSSAVSSSEDASPYQNVFIWDIQTQTQTALWSTQTAEQEKLHYIAYPERFDAEQGRVVFNHSIQTVNNERLAPMPLPNVLLVVSSPLANPQQKHLWRSTKQGEQLQLVATIEAPSSWHLDVGNGLLRLLHPQAQGLTIEEIPWHTTP